MAVGNRLAEMQLQIVWEEILKRFPTIEVTGHIVDSLLLAKILDSILDAGCDYEIAEVAIGKTSLDPSRARIEVTGDDDVLGRLVDELQVHGANRVDQHDARLVAADRDGVLPAGFYSTTNLAGAVRVEGTWLPIENPEMDCGLVVREGRALTVPMHRVRAGDAVVVGSEGVRVQAPSTARDGQAFEFMASEVSSEKPKALLVARVAERLRAARERGGQVLVVAGLAVVPPRGAPDPAPPVPAPGRNFFWGSKGPPAPGAPRPSTAATASRSRGHDACTGA